MVEPEDEGPSCSNSSEHARVASITASNAPPDEKETPQLLSELLIRYAEAKREGRTHPIVLIGAFILDFLAIHPVADGNGRLARLLTTYELLSGGYSELAMYSALPDISSATIRLVLNELRDGQEIRSEGSGSGARWHRRAVEQARE